MPMHFWQEANMLVVYTQLSWCPHAVYIKYIFGIQVQIHLLTIFCSQSLLQCVYFH